MWLRTFYLLLFLLPLEMPIVSGSYWLLKDTGDAHLLFTATIPLLLMSMWVINATQPSDGESVYYSLAGKYLFIGCYTVAMTALICDSAEPWQNVGYSIKHLVFGYLLPCGVCLAILRLSPEKRFKAWMSIYAGWVVYLAGSIP